MTDLCLYMFIVSSGPLATRVDANFWVRSTENPTSSGGTVDRPLLFVRGLLELNHELMREVIGIAHPEVQLLEPNLATDHLDGARRCRAGKLCREVLASGGDEQKEPYCALPSAGPSHHFCHRPPPRRAAPLHSHWQLRRPALIVGHGRRRQPQHFPLHPVLQIAGDGLLVVE